MSWSGRKIADVLQMGMFLFFSAESAFARIVTGIAQPLCIDKIRQRPWVQHFLNSILFYWFMSYMFDSCKSCCDRRVTLAVHSKPLISNCISRSSSSSSIHNFTFFSFALHLLRHVNEWLNSGNSHHSGVSIRTDTYPLGNKLPSAWLVKINWIKN